LWYTDVLSIALFILHERFLRPAGRTAPQFPHEAQGRSTFISTSTLAFSRYTRLGPPTSATNVLPKKLWSWWWLSICTFLM